MSRNNLLQMECSSVKKEKKNQKTRSGKQRAAQCAHSAGLLRRLFGSYLGPFSLSQVRREAGPESPWAVFLSGRLHPTGTRSGRWTPLAAASATDPSPLQVQTICGYSA